MSRKVQVWLILLLGLALRAYGVWFGLPGIYHADEPLVVHRALAYGAGDLNPHLFWIPPLASYLLFGIYGVAYLVGKILGIFSSPSHYADLFFRDPTFFYLLGRLILGSLLSTLALYLQYRLAKEWLGESKGAVYALFLFAVVPLAVRDAHYIYADVPLLVTILLAVWAAFKAYRTPSMKHFCLAGAAAGLAISAKYNGAVVLAPLFFAFLFSHKGRITFLIGAMLAAIFIFFLTNPYALLDWRTFLTDIRVPLQASSPQGWFYHLRYSLAEGVGVPILLCFLIGVILSFRQRPKEAMLVWSFPLFFYLHLVVISQPHARYGLALIPFICLAAGVGMGHFRFSKFLLFAVAFFPFVKSLMIVYLLGASDIRNEAKRWIEEHIPADSVIAIEYPPYLPSLLQNREQLQEKYQAVNERDPHGALRKRKVERYLERIKKGEKGYQLFFINDVVSQSGHFLFGTPKVPYDLEKLRRVGVEYIVIHRRTRSAEEKLLFYEQIKSLPLLASFTPYVNSQKKWTLDERETTALPIMTRELFSRRKNGYLIEIWALQPLKN